MQRPTLEFRDGEDAGAIRHRFAQLRARYPENGPFWAATEAFKGKPNAIERGGAAAMLWEHDAEVCDIRSKLEQQAGEDDIIDSPEKANRAYMALYSMRYADPRVIKERRAVLDSICKLNGWTDTGNAGKTPPGTTLPQITIREYPQDGNITDTPAT
jgi:hypothetical protein